MYDGDPKLYETGDGADLSISNGQPVMDNGLENAAYISLFSKDWWGNAVSATDEQVGSEFETLLGQALTNRTRLDAEEYAKQALAWMVTLGIAQKITVSATIPSLGMLGLQVQIDRPSGPLTLRYQINWAEQAVKMGA